MIQRKRLLLTVPTALIVGLSGGAFAQAKDGNWKKDHPRRAEVNKRLANQDKRVNQEVKEGEMSKQRAAKLHKEDRQIRSEERDMGSQNGGHITKQEQRTLNQQRTRSAGKSVSSPLCRGAPA